MSSIEKIRLGVEKIRKDLLFYPFVDNEIDPIDELGDSELASAHYWQAEAYLRLAEESLKLAIISKKKSI